MMKQATTTLSECLSQPPASVPPTIRAFCTNSRRGSMKEEPPWPCGPSQLSTR